MAEYLPHMEPLSLSGLLLIKPRIFSDERGEFLESFRQAWFDQLGLPYRFVQDNISRSGRGVIRGLHFQTGEHAQGKLITVASGRILDVAVDIRRGSPTFGQWAAAELGEHNGHELWVPPGFAHGFAVLGDHAVVQYKCTSLYHRESERGIRWDDPALSIDWQVREPILSEKDRILPTLSEIPSHDLSTHPVNPPFS